MSTQAGSKVARRGALNSGGGTLAMTLVVRDEADIIEANLRYHLAQGVDFIYAIDHNSADATPDILRRFEQMGVLRMFREEGDVHDQAPRVTRLARLAHDELGADWVINNDADEFWWPALGNLKDVLCAVPDPYGVVIARRHDFIPRPEETGTFDQRMVWRHAVSRTPTGGELGPKAAHRGCVDIVVAPGNHEIYAPPLAQAPLLPLIEVLHFPARTYEQFARKTLNTGRGYKLLPGRDAGIGIAKLELLECLERGELRDYYERWALSGAELARSVDEGSVVHDRRLRDFFGRRPPGAEGAPARDQTQVREVVGGALALDRELGAARAEAERLAGERTRLTEALAGREADLSELTLRLARAREESAALARERGDLERQLAGEHELATAREADRAELASALEAVRNSRLMRSTHRLRRLYYRLR
jgi:hypothetical protein